MLHRSDLMVLRFVRECRHRLQLKEIGFMHPVDLLAGFFILADPFSNIAIQHRISESQVVFIAQTAKPVDRYFIHEHARKAQSPSYCLDFLHRQLATEG